ncbi:MAG TPA: fibronectin type III domain-containing protein [Nocardioides sp.]|nr:fibronectin type III domain-containing protein [Nocardioides sp.]
MVVPPLLCALVALGGQALAAGVVSGNVVPTVTEVQRISAVPQANGTGTRPAFGQSLALSADGSILAVGARWQYDPASGKSHAGATYVYQREAGGGWHLAASLRSPNPVDGGEFGAGVALSADGSVLVVSQTMYTGKNLPPPWSGKSFQGGLAWVFRAADGWSTPELVAPDPEVPLSSLCATNACAQAVALSRDGTHLALSRAQDTRGAVNPPGVDVYDFDGSAWVPGERLDVAAPAAARPALALATDGTSDLLFAGYGQRTSGGSFLPGTVTVFRRSVGSATWGAAPAQTIEEPDGLTQTYFGEAVAASADGHTLLVGADSAPSVGPVPSGTQGAAYVYSSDGSSSFTLRSTLYASDAVGASHFGVDVALNGAGTKAFVSRYTVRAAYAFVRPGGDWPLGAMSESGRLDYSDTTLNDSFGAPVAVSDDLVDARGPVIASGDDVSPRSDWQGGAVYLYAPVGTLANTYSTLPGSTLTVAAPGVLGNDLRAGSADVLAATPRTLPDHGTLTLETDGSFVYVPEAGYVGTDTFTYAAVSAAFGDANEVTVTIRVDEGPPVTVPDAPTAVHAVAGDAEAEVTWTAPASDGGAPVDGYTVVASPGGASVSTSGATRAVVSGLENGTPYRFSVVAVNSVGASLPSELSAAVTPLGTLTSTPRPVISGTAVVGDRLRADPGAWAPAPVSLAYRWFRVSRSGDVDAIAGATSARYTPTRADLGHRLKVKVTGSKPAYRKVARTSALTAVVRRSG